MPFKKLALTAVSAMAFLSLAVPAFSESREADNSESMSLLKRGYGQICVGLYNPAIETLTKAIRMEKDNSSARRYLVYAQLQVGQVTEALENLKLLSLAKKPNAMDSYLLGEAHLQVGWIDTAEADFNNALTLQPNMKAATVGLIKVKVCNADYDGALKLCSECIIEAKTLTPEQARLNNYFKRLYSSIKLAQMTNSNDGGGIPGVLPGLLGPGGGGYVPPPPEIMHGT